MNAFSRIGSSTVPWLAAFGIVAAVIAWETNWGRALRLAPKLPTPAAPKPVEVALLPEYQIDGNASLRRETVERPAFVPTRRPAPTPAQEVARPRMQRGQFTLLRRLAQQREGIACAQFRHGVQTQVRFAEQAPPLKGELVKMWMASAERARKSLAGDPGKR